jgi:uncharacterized protein
MTPTKATSTDTKRDDAGETAERQVLPAGGFSSWLRRMRDALITNRGADVPCGECNACCRSSYFIHVKPEETQTLARIPGKLLFPAPGLPKGNLLMGYDEKGRCPMLIDDKCSIYEYRPMTCRNYDCRVFPAAGIEAGDDDKASIARHVRRWKFSYPGKHDRTEHSAVQAAARFLRERSKSFPAGTVPGNPAQLAVLAIKVYDVFLNSPDDSGETRSIIPDEDVAKAVMEAIEKFEAGCTTPEVCPISLNQRSTKPRNRKPYQK